MAREASSAWQMAGTAAWGSAGNARAIARLRAAASPGWLRANSDSAEDVEDQLAAAIPGVLVLAQTEKGDVAFEQRVDGFDQVIERAANAVELVWTPPGGSGGLAAGNGA